MTLFASLVLFGLLAGEPTQVAQTPDAPAAETDLAAFRRLRAEGMAAAAGDDLTTAAARLAEADGRNPNHPGLILLRARVAAASDRPDEALAQAGRLARVGVAFDPAADRTLSTLSDHPAFAPLLEAFAANRAPIGKERLSVVATVSGPVLVESVARDAARGRWLVSQVRGRTVAVLDETGGLSPFLDAVPDIGGVLGLAADPRAGVLWAATAPVPPAVHGLPDDAVAPTPALLQIDLADGRLLARYPAPGASPGDVVVAPDGTVYLADSEGGAILALAPGADALAPLLAGGVLGSPQGMVVTPDGRALIVADYASSLWRIERDTGAATRLPAPPDAALIGIDGLATDGTRLIALQNGMTPQRVLRLALAGGWDRIERVETLAANLPEIEEPTTGLVENGELVFVSRSQWSDFDAQGAARTETPGPGLIARLRLD
ncbi:hypothetical protein [Brevundimonas sp. FT23028]|uniref:SMP-30/gluconolactonase/LRE family protein n=1 Tax=Brevundimonas sp. FT23028 TaxID=3393748 RepID=UPI003B5865CD